MTKSCVALSRPHSRSGSSVHGISQARILEGVAISFSRIQNRISFIICHLLAYFKLPYIITYLLMSMIFEFYKAGTVCLTPQVNPMRSLVFLLLFPFLAVLLGMWDLSPLTRDWTRTPPHWELRIITTGPPGKPIKSPVFSIGLTMIISWGWL